MGRSGEDKLFWVKGNNFAHVEKVNTYAPERCGEMALDARSTGVWD